MKTALATLLAVVALVPAGVAHATKIDCGSLTVHGDQLPVQIRAGAVSCNTARRAVRRFFPRSGRGTQYFRLARRQWFCADSHGQELTRYGIVAHCLAGRVKVVLLEPLPKPGETRKNPILFGHDARVGDWQVRVVSVTPDATAAVLAENMFNEPPAPGWQFYVARVRATYLGADSAAYDGGYRLRAVGDSNVGYRSFIDSCGVAPDELSDAEVFGGGTIEGNVCWSVRAADAASLVMYDVGEGLDDPRVYFSLTE
ncbi:MAG: hypothetical protein ACJ76L_12480 [Conexibacter sp.]